MSRLKKITSISDQFSFKTLFIVIVFLLIPIVLFLRLNQKPVITSAAWWDGSWSYRRSVNISNTGGNQSNVYITISDIDTSDATRFQSDAGDLRFTDQSGSLLQYFIVSGAGSTAATIHINFPTLTAGDTTIFMYYGNSSAPNGFVAADFTTPASSCTPGLPAPEELGAGAVAYWKFDDGTGDITIDSANTNNGTLTGTTKPAWESEENSISGKCLYLDGSDGYVAVNNDASLNPTAEVSVSIWVKNQRQTGKNTFILHKAGGTGGYGIEFGTTDKPSFFVYWNSGSPPYQFCNSNIVLPQNQWTHITGSFKQDDSLKIYINGKLANSCNPILPGPIGAMASTSLRIGYQGWQGSDNANFKGYIDEAKVYPYARTSEQILADYNSGLAGASFSNGSSVALGSFSEGKSLSDGLVAYWKMDEGVGTTALDSSGNNNMANFNIGTSVPGWTTGKFGVGISLGGNNNTAGTTIPSLSVATGSKTTLSFWIKWDGTEVKMPFAFGDSTNFDIFFLSGGLGINTWNSDLWGVSSTGMANTWKHITLVITNGAIKSTEIYIDGLKQTTGQIQGTTDDVRSISTSFYLGGGFAGNNINGILDEVRLYNRALSLNEVTNLYNYVPGPLIYYPMDEKSGLALNDKSGNNITGNFNAGTSAPSWTSGKYGSGLSFSQSNNSGVDFDPTSVSSKIRDQITISTWYKHQGGSYVMSSSGGGNRFVQSGNNITAQILTSTGNNNCSSTGSILADNAWHYLTSTFNGSNISLYIDGIQRCIGGTSPGNISSLTTTWRIGGRPSLSSVDGQLDEFRIYNYVRTPQQIIEDMNAGNPQSSSKSMTVNYNFDNTSSDSIKNFGTLGSSANASFASSPKNPLSNANGKNNSSLTFDGSNDHTTTPSSSSLNIGTGGYSVFAWVKAAATASNHDIIAHKGGASISDGGFWWGIETNGKQDLNINHGSGWIVLGVQSNASIADNTWHRVGFTWDPAIGVKFYLDGKIDKAISAVSSYDIQGTSALELGGISCCEGFSLNGSIDDFKIYNYTLSLEDIKQDYNQSSTMVFGTSNQTIGGTTSSLEYCVPGDTSPCSSPVAEWKLDENNGTSVYDTSGNNNTGIFQNGPVWSPGKFGSSVKFGGVSGIGISDSSTTALASNGTVQAWIKPLSYPTAGNWSVVLVKGNWGGGTNYYSIYYSGPTNLCFAAAGPNSAQNRCVPTSNTPLNTWSHLVLKWDGSTFKLFINGKEIDSGGMSDTPDTSGAVLYIGNYGSGSPYSFNGSIDHVRLYNYARTPAQIAHDYNKGAPVAWWKIDECQSSTIYDASGNTNHGTLSVGSSGTQTDIGTCQTSGTAWANGAGGKVNSSLNFDGSDDQITVPVDSIVLNNYHSFSFWLKPFNSSAGNIIQHKSWCGSGGFRIHRSNTTTFQYSYDYPSGTGTHIALSSNTLASQ